MSILLVIKLIFLSIVCFYIITALIYEKKIDLFSPFFIFPLWYISYLFIGSLQILQDDIVISTFQWLLYFLGLICFYGGGTIPHLLLSRVQKIKLPKKWDPDRILIASSLLFFLALISAFIIYSKVGIPLFSKNINATRLQVSQSGYIAEFIVGGEVVFMLSSVGLFILKKRPFLFSLLLMATIMLSLMGGTRTSLIRQVLPVLIIFHYMVKKIPKRVLIIFVLLSLIFIGGMNFFRVYKNLGSMVTSDLRARGYHPYLYWSYFVFRDFKHGPEGLARVLDMIPRKYNYLYGRLHVLPFLMPLPGHQPQPGVVLKEMAGLEFEGVGMAATMLAPQYADFGVPGIILGMFIVGFIFNLSYLIARMKHHPFYYLIYGVIFTNFILGVRSNYLNFEILWTLFLLSVVHLFSREKRSSMDKENNVIN